MSTPEYEVNIQGRLSWELVFDYDNTTNNATIKEKIVVHTVESINYTSYLKNFNALTRRNLAETNHASAEIGGSFKAFTASVDWDDTSSEVTDTVEKTTEVSFRGDYRKETTYEREGVYDHPQDA